AVATGEAERHGALPTHRLLRHPGGRGGGGPLRRRDRTARSARAHQRRGAAPRDRLPPHAMRQAERPPSTVREAMAAGAEGLPGPTSNLHLLPCQEISRSATAACWSRSTGPTTCATSSSLASGRKTT